MRAWWSTLLVPQKRGELAEQVRRLVRELGRAEPVARYPGRSSRGCGVSSPPISWIAWSQEMRCQAPPTFFIGYLVRRSPIDDLARRGALAAMRALVDRALEDRLLADPDAVARPRPRSSSRPSRTGRRSLSWRARARRRPRPPRPCARCRPCPEPGERQPADAACLQEIAPREPAREPLRRPASAGQPGGGAASSSASVVSLCGSRSPIGAPGQPRARR